MLIFLNLSLAYKYRNDVPILYKSDTNGVSIFSFKKPVFADLVLTLILVFNENNPC